MTLYYAETKDKKGTLAFEGVPLVCNNKNLFEVLIDIDNKRRFSQKCDINDFNIREIETNIEVVGSLT
jgi:hypothetical protein